MVPRARRIDVRGACFHVENRALDGRTLFERPDDARDFLSRIARVVRGRHLDLHAYALLPTRFHLLVSSPEGRLAQGLGRVQDAYARELNRRLGRRGPLFRGRYRARLLAAHVHRAAVLGYVHESPVRAGLAESPAAYPYGSARLVRVSLRPPWLDARLLERWGARTGHRPSPGTSWDAGWSRPTPIRPTSTRSSWRLPPTWRRGSPPNAARTSSSARRPSRTCSPRPGAPRSGSPCVVAGVPARGTCWRRVCCEPSVGLTYAEVAERLGVAATTAHARVRLHFGALGGAAYAGTAGAVLHCALGLEYGALLSPLGRALPERRSG